MVDTASTKEDLEREFGYPDGLSDVIPLSISSQLLRALDGVTKERARQALGLPSVAQVVLSISSDSPRKNLDAFYYLVNHSLPDITFLRVGPVDYSKIRDCPPGRVLTKRPVNESDLAVVYKASDLLFSPSYAEGFGLPVLEAMSAGLPVLASDIPAFREVAEDSAVYSLPDNFPNMKEIVDGLLSDRHRLAELSRRGSARAGRFRPESLRPLYIGFYDRLLSQRAS